MSLAVWLGAARKCSAAVVGLDLVLGLSMVRRCSLKRSFKRRLQRRLQYIGETKRRLKDRFNEHRRTIDNPNTKSKPTTAAEHFLTAPNHTANDMQLIPIEKVFSNRDSVRKAREAFLISKGRTLLPHGLNIREEPY